VRSFAPDIPAKEDIIRIIRAGLLAPYAAQAVAGKDFRRFFVLQEETPKLALVAALGRRQAKRMAEQLRDELAANPSLEDQAKGFVKDWSNWQRGAYQASAAPPTTSSWQNGEGSRLPSSNHSLTVWRTCG